MNLEKTLEPLFKEKYTLESLREQITTCPVKIPFPENYSVTLSVKDFNEFIGALSILVADAFVNLEASKKSFDSALGLLENIHNLNGFLLESDGVTLTN